ncbi:MAG: HAD-IIA family hydrolase [Chloroflexi bacterium]|nr:HAD-IIA family hydrolase [Chloroflexota bacterium]
MTLASVKSLLIDLDGVVYRGNTRLKGASRLFRFLEQHQIRFCLLTNNSTLTAAQYAAKLGRLGISAPEHSIFTSGQAVAQYLSKVAAARSGVFIIGEEGLRRPIEEAGFRLEEANPGYVLIGLDRHLTYRKLSIAALAVRQGAKLVAANPDKTFPTERGLLPGCGAIVAAVEACTDQSAVVVGKPNPEMLRLAMQQLGATTSETAILGDRLDTDVLGGQRVGITTILVLTGISAGDQLKEAPIQPDLVFEDLDELVDNWG